MEELLFLNKSLDLKRLYEEYLRRQCSLVERLCESFELEHILIASGPIKYHFKDDREYPFKVNPYFKQWLPLLNHPNSYLLLVPGQRPTLFLYQPEDIWLAWPGLENCNWPARGSIIAEFNIIEIKKLNDITRHLPCASTNRKKTAFIGSIDTLLDSWTFTDINNDAILSFINYHRIYKSPYEVFCIYQANLDSAPGHKVVKNLFRNGATEAELLWAYINTPGTNKTQQDSPYEPMIGINEHGAILHYQLKSAKRPKTGFRSLLIDAGSEFAGYAADITRTYSYKDGEYADLVNNFDTLQKNLVSEIEINMTKVELYRRSYLAIAKFMKDQQFIRCSFEQAYEDELVSVFYPHGLGHFLGLQVHDVGENMMDETGAFSSSDSKFPKQTSRLIEPNMVFTIEPGFYFIKEKLNALRSSRLSKLINWDNVDRFIPYGGIRIEDDIYVSNNQVLNLTRMALDN